MELSLLWLLLPVAAASGWIAARRSMAQQVDNAARKLSSDYLKGLNYLLNEQPDKAIDIFIKLIEVDNETVETHLALGILFRCRGEVNRAIRIHQNIAEQAGLSSRQRSLAILELGHDYQRAGLLDRAEDLFRQLIDAGHHQIRAYRELLNIYQQEHEWDKAIPTAEQLAKLSGENYRPVMAQYHCEQAEQFRRQGLTDKTREALRRALNTDPGCARASLVEGYLALDRSDAPSAVQAFKRVEKQDADYLSEIIEPLRRCYQQMDKPNEFVEYLHYILKHYGNNTSMLMLAKLIKEKENEKSAVNFVINQLKEHPSIAGVEHLLAMTLPETKGTEHDNLVLLKDIISQLARKCPAYRCTECGFTGKTLHWQCPSCKQWNTVKPMQEQNAS